jgi:hypothetical protein
MVQEPRQKYFGGTMSHYIVQVAKRRSTLLPP